jgi:hypothetical protein
MDNAKNGDETDVDCGGKCMTKCAAGKACTVNGDCVSQSCQMGQCAAISCSDKMKNGSETDVDCGGTCPGCGTGLACAKTDDCASKVCTMMKCAAATCADKVKNQDESDVDCGGKACAKCADGKTCAVAADCASLVCDAGKCLAPKCNDTVKNGTESDVDCGGSCTPCPLAKTCKVGKDCASLYCAAGKCTTPRWCKDLVAAAAPDGIYAIDPDGAGAIQPFQTYCRMSRGGGGWTLVLVSSDDGQNTWTWNKRTLWTTDMSLVGSVNSLHRDYKNLGQHVIPTTDLLFEHLPSDVWAQYNDVGNGTKTIGQIIAGFASPNCDADTGFPQTGGNLAAGMVLCSTSVFFNMGDFEGGVNSCKTISGCNHAVFGPVWSAYRNHNCPFDDPAFNGLGPDGAPACGGDQRNTEERGLGYARSLNLNKGPAGTGVNNMRMYVR